MLESQLEHLKQYDPELGHAIGLELNRQKQNIELIASENIVSAEVLMATGSILTNKYAEGYSGKRYYGGCEYVDIVEDICIDRAKKLFGCNYVNVQPHSGSQANNAVYAALCQPGDVVLGMDLDHGGHLTHGCKVNFSGKVYKSISYTCDSETGCIDYDQVRALAMEHRPRMIIAGASAYPRTIDFEKFGAIAKECGAYLMADIAHIAGLVVAGEHPSPFPYADIVTTTTHKTLRGPRGGMIMTNDAEIAKKINRAIFPGTQGGPLMHVIAGKAVAFGEALRDDFKAYQHQIRINAQVLAQTLVDGGMKLVTGGTDNHMMLIDLSDNDISGRELEERLDSVHITVNKNKVPGDKRSAAETSGIRIGTPAVTTRGFKEEDMVEVGKLILLTAFSYEEKKDEILARVDALCSRFPIY